MTRFMKDIDRKARYILGITELSHECLEYRHNSRLTLSPMVYYTRRSYNSLGVSDLKPGIVATSTLGGWRPH